MAASGTGECEVNAGVASRSALAEEFRRSGLLAILRGVPDDQLMPMVEALVDGGIRMVEVSLTTRGALQQIERVAGNVEGEAFVGAGTVTNRAEAQAAVDAGAGFLVTPHLVAEVNAFGVEHGIEVFGGAMTPTEIATSRAQGNTFVKVFPAGPLGPSYLKALLGPYPDAGLVPVGGVDLANAQAFIRAGAVGLGLGGALTSTGPAFDARRVTQTATEFVQAVALGRERVA